MNEINILKSTQEFDNRTIGRLHLNRKIFEKDCEIRSFKDFRYECQHIGSVIENAQELKNIEYPQIHIMKEGGEKSKREYIKIDVEGCFYYSHGMELIKIKYYNQLKVSIYRYE